MTGRRAAATLAASRGLCRLAASALPRTVRARYAAEWQADLEADPLHSWAYATSVLLHVVALRLAVSQPSATRRPLRCRLHLHHDVSVHDNPDNRRFTSHVCTRCGRVKDDWQGAPEADDLSAWVAGGGLH